MNIAPLALLGGLGAEGPSGATEMTNQAVAPNRSWTQKAGAGRLTILVRGAEGLMTPPSRSHSIARPTCRLAQMMSACAGA